MIVYSSLLTLTTNPLDLMKVVNLFIKPLKAFKVDTNALAIAGIISIRFIPLIFDEVEKIKIAHKFRKHFKKSFLVKIDFVSNMLVPLFIKVSHYSEQLTINLVQRDNWDQILKISKPAFKDQVIFCLLLVLITGIKFV
jgi:energy-coupling factor transport system permease protein